MPHTFNHIHELPAPPRDDKRVIRITREINRFGKRPDALIEVLHVVQDLYGYVPLDVMYYVSKEMHIPPSRVYGVATFYHFFSLKARGEHNCIICMGTACYVKGAQKVLERLESEFHLKAGDTTPDGKLGINTARCFGCCGMAPVVIMDEQIFAKVTPEEIVKTAREKIKK